MTAQSITTQIRKGALECCLLVLMQGQPRYGFELVGLLSEAGMVASEGTVYPILSRLRRGELVTTEWKESAGGAPRRYYSLTPAGRATVAEFREVWQAFKAGVDGILAEGTQP